MNAALKRARLTEGSVRGHLFEMAVPMLWGILATMSYNIADTYFIGRLGTGQLAAISFTFPVVMLAINLSIGLSAGASSVVARRVGSGDWQAVQRLASGAVLLGIGVSLTFTMIGLLTMEPLFLWLGAEPELLPDIKSFMTIWYLGIGFMILSIVAISLLRAVGETRLPGYIMVASSFLNIVLDPILIFGLLGAPRLELAGAAIATVATRGLLAVVVLWLLIRKRRMLELTWPGWRNISKAWGQVLHVGLPATGTNMIIPLATGVVVAMVATYGSEAVAGFGVATRVEGVALVAFYALSAVIGPVAGQNLGAGKIERVEEALKVSAGFCFFSGLAVALLLLVSGGAIAGLFSEDTRVIEVARDYLWLVPISYGAAGVVMVTNAAFNGLGCPGRAVVVSLCRMVVLYVPLAFFGSMLFGLAGIFIAAAIANLASGLGGFLWIRRVCAQKLPVPSGLASHIPEEDPVI